MNIPKAIGARGADAASPAHATLSFRMRLRNLFLPAVTTVALLQAGMAQAANPAKKCPALAGTYKVGNTAWIDVFHVVELHTVRPTKQNPQHLTVTSRENGYVLSWHTPRATALAGAKRLADADPYKYGLWLDKALRAAPTTPDPNNMDQVWFNDMARLGPVFRVDVPLKFRECERGWFLIGTTGRSGPADVKGGMTGDRDAQLWLGRNADGSLALRWRERRKAVIIRNTRYTTEQAIPLWSEDHLDKWLATPPTDLSPLREDELPARGQPPKCKKDNQEENRFFDRMDTILPPRARHINRARGSLYLGRMQDDGDCEPMPYPVTIAADSESDFAIVEDFLKKDPFFARMVSRVVSPGDGRQTYVVFNMILKL